jgi:hypothetical protein
MIPDAEVTHLVRDRVMLALAAAGVLDGPDEGLRARTLGALGHRTLLAWRDAALTLLAWASHIPELKDDESPCDRLTAPARARSEQRRIRRSR